MTVLKNIVFLLLVLALPCHAQIINHNTAIIVSPGTTIKILGSDFANKSEGRLTNNGSLEVRNSFSNDGAFLSGAESSLKIGGNLESNGIFSSEGGTVSLEGNTIQSIGGNGTTLFHNLAVVSPGAYLKTHIGVKGLLTLQGDLTAQQGKLLTLDGAFDDRNGLSEDINRLYMGQLSKSGIIDNATPEQNFGKIGVTIDNMDAGDWGKVTIVRSTGTGSAVPSPLDPSKEGIERLWHISSQFTPSDKNVNLTLSWLADESNGLGFLGNLAQVWKSKDDGASWEAVGGPQNIVAEGNQRTVSVQTNSFSMWTVSDVVTPLPVTWLYFKAKSIEEGNRLDWATASEVNSNRFEVQRSHNAKDFKSIGTLDAVGFSSQKVNYRYLDAEAASLSGTLYYRLKQGDLDGKSEYSAVIAVAQTKAKDLRFTASPNPFSPQDALTLQLPSGLSAGTAKVTLTNMEGVPVYEGQLVVPGGGRKIGLGRIPVLASGVYMLKLQVADDTAVVKVIRL